MPRLYKAFIVEVGEGAGTEANPYRLVRYVYNENLELVGCIDSHDEVARLAQPTPATDAAHNR